MNYLHTHQLVLRVSSNLRLTDSSFLSYICQFTKGLPRDIDFNYFLKTGKVGYLSLELQKDGRTDSGNRLNSQGGFNYILRIPLSVNPQVLSRIPALLERITNIHEAIVTISFDRVDDQRTILLENLNQRSQEIEKIIQKKSSVTDENPTKFMYQGFYVGKDFPEAEEVFIVEGRRDLDALAATNEFYNTLALGGHSYDIVNLKNILTNKITTLFLDSDKAGEVFQAHILESLEIDFVVTIPFKTEVEFLTPRMINKLITRRIPTEVHLRRQRNLVLINRITSAASEFNLIDTLLTNHPFQSLISLDTTDNTVRQVTSLDDYLLNPYNFERGFVLFNGLLTTVLYSLLRKNNCAHVVCRGVVSNIKTIPERCKVSIIDLL